MFLLCLQGLNLAVDIFFKLVQVGLLLRIICSGAGHLGVMPRDVNVGLPGIGVSGLTVFAVLELGSVMVSSTSEDTRDSIVVLWSLSMWSS